MDQRSEDRLRETLSSLSQQCGKLKEILQTYHSDYDAAFDRHGAIEAVRRWSDRTAKILADRVSAADGKKKGHH